MKYKIIIIFIALSQCLYLFSQTSLEKICAEVSSNNLYLEAYKKNIEAGKLSHLTGLWPANPEVEYHYLWGYPSNLNNRTDISVLQSFDFPTAYLYKKKISGAQNIQLDISYQKEVIDLQNQVSEIYIKIVAANIFKIELNKRLDIVRQLKSSFEKKLNLGETNILDYNNVQLSFYALQNEIDRNDMHLQSLHDELISLNGGKAIHVTDTIYPLFELPIEFDQWFKQRVPKIPELQLIRQEVETGISNEKLATALKMPKIQTGYMSESVPGEKFQGLVAGITLPLWENKNTTKYARALTQFYQGTEIDVENSLFYILKQHYNTAVNLLQSMNNYKQHFEKYNNSRLLFMAMEAGEISLIEYSYGISQYFESKDMILTMERDYYLSVNELFKYR